MSVRVRDSADVIQADLNNISIRQPDGIVTLELGASRAKGLVRSDAFIYAISHSRSSENHISRHQGDSHREEGYNLLHTEDHVGSGTILLQLSIDLAPNFERLRVFDDAGMHEGRTPWRPAVSAFTHGELRPGLATTINLPPTVGHIVPNAVTRNNVQSLGFRDVECLLPDHDYQFGLIVHG